MNEETPKPNKKINALKTFAGDMAEAVREKELSIIKIALAEREKREKELLDKKKEGSIWLKILPIVGGLILISSAIFGIYFLSKTKNEIFVPEIKNEFETFITYNSKSIIDTTNKENLLELIQKEKIINEGLVKAIFLTENIKNETEKNPKEIVVEITTEKFLSLLGINTPNALLRSFSSKYLLGGYLNTKINEDKKNNTFLIFQTNSYDQAYASMLEWEPNMYKDLSLLFNLPKLNDLNLGQDWRDVYIDNKDVRVLYGDNKEKILYYVFVNKNKLLITNSLESLKEIITRLNIKNY